MEITLMNGNPDAGNANFDRSLLSLKRFLSDNSCMIHGFNLRDMNIQYCIGCWDCWWKTPGICRHRDDMEKILRAIVASDLLIMASPIIVGFISSLLKKVNDRMIPLLHPYIKLINGECHHWKRYDRYPALGLILEPESKESDEDVELISDVYKRFAINFHSELRFVTNNKKNQEAVIHETCGI